jgi:hypothetical protein
LDFLVKEVLFILTNEMPSKEAGPKVFDDVDLFDKELSEILRVMGGEGEFVVEELCLELELVELL